VETMQQFQTAIVYIYLYLYIHFFFCAYNQHFSDFCSDVMSVIGEVEGRGGQSAAKRRRVA